ncbi:GNAT family N-acetyltransferase [Brachybacterium hainanense]|uniref:GNAT family N-acetyltransferase n=1 Tax=Brachybacterium hainanense TaxID=1541174 RepID=A0ABV6R6B0_9MICO
MSTPSPAPARVDLPVPADAAAIAQVHVTGWREAYEYLLPERFWDAEALAGRVRMWELITRWHPDRIAERLRVARDAEGGVIGFALTGPAEEDPRELHALYVLSPWYGTGTGAALLTELLGDLPASLWVAQENPRARRFYTKMGFVEDGLRKVDPSLEDLAEIRMVRGHRTPPP